MNLKFYLRGLGVGLIVCALILGIHHYRTNKTVMTDDQIRARAEELGMVDGSSRLTDEMTMDAEELLESMAEVSPPEKEEIPPADESEQAPIDDVTSEISQEVYDDPDAAVMDASAEATDENEASTDASSSETTAEDSQESSASDETATEETAADNTEETQADAAETAENNEDAAEASSSSDDSNVNAIGGQITIVSGDSSYRVAQKLADAGIVSSASSYDLFLCNNGYDRYIRTGNFTIPAGSSDLEIAKMITGR